MEGAQLILTTCPNLASATQIAETLVQQQLAACVNIVPGLTSVYAWQGKIEHSSEYLLFIKAPAANYGRIEQAILAVHPYELPEIIAVSIDYGLRPYLHWLADSASASP